MCHHQVLETHIWFNNVTYIHVCGQVPQNLVQSWVRTPYQDEQYKANPNQDNLAADSTELSLLAYSLVSLQNSMPRPMLASTCGKSHWSSDPRNSKSECKVSGVWPSQVNSCVLQQFVWFQLLVGHPILTEQQCTRLTWPARTAPFQYCPQSGSLSNFHLTNSKVSAMLVGSGLRPWPPKDKKRTSMQWVLTEMNARQDARGGMFKKHSLCICPEGVILCVKTIPLEVTALVARNIITNATNVPWRSVSTGWEKSGQVAQNAPRLWEKGFEGNPRWAAQRSQSSAHWSMTTPPKVQW